MCVYVRKKERERKNEKEITKYYNRGREKKDMTQNYDISVQIGIFKEELIMEDILVNIYNCYFVPQVNLQVLANHLPGHYLSSSLLLQ